MKLKVRDLEYSLESSEVVEAQHVKILVLKAEKANIKYRIKLVQITEKIGVSMRNFKKCTGHANTSKLKQEEASATNSMSRRIQKEVSRDNQQSKSIEKENIGRNKTRSIEFLCHRFFHKKIDFTNKNDINNCTRTKSSIIIAIGFIIA